MLGNIFCWVIAIALLVAKANGTDEWHIRVIFAMGFILLGIISKAVDAYQEVHTKEENKEENKETNNT